MIDQAKVECDIPGRETRKIVNDFSFHIQPFSFYMQGLINDLLWDVFLLIQCATLTHSAAAITVLMGSALKMVPLD